MPPTGSNPPEAATAVKAGLIRLASELGFAECRVAPALPADWQTLADHDEDDWLALSGVGPRRAEELGEFFTHPEIGRLAERLAELGIDGFGR